MRGLRGEASEEAAKAAPQAKPKTIAGMKIHNRISCFFLICICIGLIYASSNLMDSRINVADEFTIAWGMGKIEKFIPTRLCISSMNRIEAATPASEIAIKRSPPAASICSRLSLPLRFALTI